MEKYRIVKIQEQKEWIERAAEWFHQKWGIPKETYSESMEACFYHASAVPQWYLVLNEEIIIAGIGVIENDFHDRRDLSPNICALYVEEAYRRQGIAGRMLHFVCNEFRAKGAAALYLITDHTSFYERYGWEFLCMVQVEGEPAMTRMYVHRM